MIKFCKNCLIPNSRPRIIFNKDGICNACIYSEQKKKYIGMKEKKNF